MFVCFYNRFNKNILEFFFHFYKYFKSQLNVNKLPVYNSLRACIFKGKMDILPHLSIFLKEIDLCILNTGTDIFFYFEKYNFISDIIRKN